MKKLEDIVTASVETRADGNRRATVLPLGLDVESPGLNASFGISGGKPFAWLRASDGAEVGIRAEDGSASVRLTVGDRQCLLLSGGLLIENGADKCQITPTGIGYEPADGSGAVMIPFAALCQMRGLAVRPNIFRRAVRRVAGLFRRRSAATVVDDRRDDDGPEPVILPIRSSISSDDLAG